MYSESQIKILNDVKRQHKLEISNHHRNFQTVSKLNNIIKNYDMSINYTGDLSVHHYAYELNHSILYDAWAIWEEIDDILQCDDYKFTRIDENKYLYIEGLKNGKKEITLFYSFNSVSDCKVIYEEVTETRIVSRVVCD